MSKRTIVIAVIAAGIGLATLGVAWAVGPEDAGLCSYRAKIGQMIHGRLARMGELRNELDVTDTQRAEIRSILQDHRDELRPAMLEVLEHKRALRNEVLAEQPSEAAIRAQADALGDAIGDTAVAISEVTGEARTVLTPEQLSLIEQAISENQQAMDDFIDSAPAN
jgi:Spy/CpxP family protein refolding chaperone